MELLGSLLLSPDDAKKGETVTKSKCKILQPQKKDDHDAEDQGNSERRRGPDQRSSEYVSTSTQAHRLNPDSGRRPRSDSHRRRSSYFETEKLNDEEL